MKKLTSLLLIVVTLFSFGCAQSKVIDGKRYDPKGVFTLDDKDKGIHYRVSVGNVVWSVITLESVIIPVILCGWYLWEPEYINP